MKADKFNNLFFGVIIFLTFIGFYALLLLAINAGMSGFTRQLTIPIRGVIGFCSVLLFVYGAKNNASYVKWFIVFILIYITRIFIDYINNEFFYIPYQDLVFYFISFTLIPFLGISRVDWRKINFSKLYKAFLSSAFLFSLLTILLYGRFVGQVGRLNTTTVGESVISPLILSYCGALIIGVVATYLMYNRNQNKLLLLLSLATITMALVPFFLGASRGSIFALFFPFLLIGISSFTFKKIIIYILLFTVLIIGLIYLDDYFGSGLLRRFTGTTEAIKTGGSSASRLGIWKLSFNQFLDYPIFGDKLNTTDIDHYPHNIFIETLQSIGFIGFTPFIVLVVKGIKACMYIFKRYIKLSWIPIFFIQAIMYNSFSGAIYTAAWFWTSLAMVLSIEYWLKKTTYTKNSLA